MDDRLLFRRRLVSRLMGIAALGALASPLAAGAGCGGKVVVDGGGGNGQGGQGGSPSTGTGTMSQQCFAWTGGTPCPTQAEAAGMLNLACGDFVSGDGVFSNGQCCYPITSGSCGPGGTGRPYVVEDRPIAAGVRHGAARGWTWDRAPETRSLSIEDRAALAAAWARDGRMEHASVASFGRFALDLLAVGAPADLVADAHQAAIDEVKHARICFALASAYEGRAIAPGSFPFGGSAPIAGDLAELAAATVREGCIGETLAALQAVEQRARALDPAVREALGILAEDEARHAELAWRTVAWVLREGGAEVKRAVAAAFAEAERGLAAPVEEPWSEALAAHGRAEPVALHAALGQALREVILPCARALLG